MDEEEAMIRVRMSAHDAHYGGNLVDGARILGLFGDVATELSIRLDGSEGLFLRYDEVEFLTPVYAGDFIEAVGRVTRIGKTSRAMEFEAKKVIRYLNDPNDPAAADFLKEPIVTTRAKGVCVTQEKNQRKKAVRNG
jgi:3-aminobutyryl-CoA ammonia-lyase